MASHQHDDAHDSDYVHGKMDISDQTGTYQGFLVATQWGFVLIAAMVTCMTLIWGIDVPWLQAVLGCGALAIVAGLGMKMGGSFTITSVAITIVGLISGGIYTLVSLFG
jgi:Bacterial aa3 type cytochrome c oxidase subunit IV